MKLFTTKAFRYHLAKCAKYAETETVYIKRPQNRLLRLESVPQKDADIIINHLTCESALCSLRQPNFMGKNNRSQNE